MSDQPKKSGLFINKKAAAASAAAPAAPAAGSKPKDVKRRWMYVGVGVIGVVVVASTMFGGKQEVKRGPSKREQAEASAMISVTPAKADQTAFESKFGRELEDLRKGLEESRKERASLEKEVEELRKAKEGKGSANAPQMPSDVVAPPSMNNSGGLGQIAPPPPPQPPRDAKVPVTQGGMLPPTSGRTPEILTMTPPMGSQGEDPMVFEAPQKAGSSSSAAPSSQGGVAVRSRYTKNASAGMLPAGSFAPVALLNGLDAGTSSATQTNPMPVLMNITDQATLPGAAKYRLKSCFVLGTGYGDLSAERVYVRFARLSCVDKADRLVLSQEVQGYLVDSDGKLGLRGVVMDRQGAKLGKAMLAGFAQGLSGALGQAQSSVSTNLSTGQTATSMTGSAALRASGLSGAQVAASQLAEFYLKEAQSIFPVISIDAGRTGTIVFSGSAALNWTNGDSQYVQQVTPTNN